MGATASEHIDVLARAAGPDEHERLWKIMTGVCPIFDEYQAATERPIPVVVLEPV